MNGLGSGENGQLTFLDCISVISFIVASQNLDLNATQNDIQDIMRVVDETTNRTLTEIHTHLQQQDAKLTKILNLLEVQNDSSRDI